MLKLVKIVTTMLIICGLVFLSFGCSSKANSTTVKTQTYTVEKSSLSVAVTGTGNLALSRTEDLAFEIAGYVEEVLVKEGESVKEGQELARLDTSEWDKQLRTLSKALVTAERQVAAKESAVTKAERQIVAKESAVTKAERQVTAKELALRQAQLDLQTAEDNLSEISAVKAVQDDIDNAEYTLKLAKSMLAGEFTDSVQLYDVGYWSQLVVNAKADLADAQRRLQDILDGSNLDVSDDVAQQVAAKQLQVEKSQLALQDAETAVDDAEVAVIDAQLAVDDAQIALVDAQADYDDARLDLTDAQNALDEAKGLSPIIKASFDGFITKINVTGGDDVQKGTIAMQLADPNQFAAKILVTEEDVFSVKEGAGATVSLSALSDISFPAKITKISPTASVSSGVVNYAVTVTLTSLQPITASQNAAIRPPSTSATGTATSDNSTIGTLPALPQSTTGATQPPGAALRSVPSDNMTSTTSSQSVTLRDGLSATVSIISQHKDNILVVPSKAITRQGGNSTVQVVTATGTETRVVKTGMTDGSYTEITEGLSEGEQVIIKTSTSSASSTSSTTRTDTQIGIPGLGGQGGAPPGGGF